MANNDDPNMIRLMESMEKHGQKEAGEKYTNETTLDAAADINEKFAWAKKTCAFLEENFDDDTVKAIRMDCACGPQYEWIQSVKDAYDASISPEDFVEKTNALELGYWLEYDGTSYYLMYPQCYCDFVNQVEDKLTKTWCYCTLGYSKKMFEYVLGKEVEVELITSVKLGDKECRIKVTEKV